MRETALVFPVFVLYVVTIGRVSMTATDVALIALGERFEKLLLEHMDAWLEWAPRMRAAHAEVRDNMAALAVAIQRTGCDVAQARTSELERTALRAASNPGFNRPSARTFLAACRSGASVVVSDYRPNNVSGHGPGHRLPLRMLASASGPSICRSKTFLGLQP